MSESGLRAPSNPLGLAWALQAKLASVLPTLPCSPHPAALPHSYLFLPLLALISSAALDLHCPECKSTLTALDLQLPVPLPVAAGLQAPQHRV